MSKQETDKDIVTVPIRMGHWFPDFIEAYLEFLGSKDTVEDFCRDSIFKTIEDLLDCMRALPGYDPETFFKKHPNLWYLLYPKDKEET